MEPTVLLRQVAIFRDLDTAVLADLGGRMRPRTVEAGTVVVSAEESGDSMFVIASGKVKVVLYGQTGREIILSILKGGDFFGEMSLFDRQPRSANVVAVAETQLLALDRDAFHKRHADEVIGNLALLDVYARVARVLRELALKQGEQVEGGILIRERPTQQEIAGLVGTSRETVSRALSEFTKRGLLEVEGKQVLVRWSFLRELHEAA